MLKASRERVEALPADARVLDVGGFAAPLHRADWVLDLMAWETRGLYGATDPALERFSAQTWVQRDICSREPWPFAEGAFDFAVCSHTLEDVRDPVWVCSELSRVARAGYVEVPSRLVEQSFGVQGGWVGWGQHHWLIDVVDGGAGVRLQAPHPRAGGPALPGGVRGGAARVRAGGDPVVGGRGARVGAGLPRPIA